jgi:sulfite reductase alpha subunit-like flavoprotein
MTAITGELNNPIVFKQYILNLLEDDALFKQQFLTVLLKNNPPKAIRPLRKYAKKDRQKYLEKYNIRLETIQALQALFSDQPPAQVIIDDIKNPLPKTIL